ncbi:MAG: spermidine/putrescine transport system permease protein [Verrucomicrobiota bacterium]|jgi:spermidine/putrescine transport system permease protein
MPPLLRCVAWLLFAFLYAPILVVVVFSFNTARFGASWQGFTLDWYRKLFANEIALDALRHTLILAIASTLVATAIGSLLGYALRRFTFTGRRLMIQLLHIPVFVPDIVMAVSLLLLFKFLRQWMGIFELGLHTMALAHITFQIPFVAIVVRARLAGLDPVLEEAAHDLGGDARQVFRHVTLPLMLPGIFAGALLAFTLSLDDFVVSFFTSGAGSVTLPILIYSSVKRGITPEINALSTILIVLSAAATVTVTLLQRRERP